MLMSPTLKTKGSLLSRVFRLTVSAVGFFFALCKPFARFLLIIYECQYFLSMGGFYE